MPSNPLDWTDEDFNQKQAKADPYTYVIWCPEDDSRATLRIIRRSASGGIMVPQYDFAIHGPDQQTMMAFAQKADDLFRELDEYNTLAN